MENTSEILCPYTLSATRLGVFGPLGFGRGDSTERTAARRHGIDITKPLEQESRPKEAAICNINRAEPGEAGKSESRIGGVERWSSAKAKGSVWLCKAPPHSTSELVAGLW
jgi:hypothetical protein